MANPFEELRKQVVQDTAVLTHMVSALRSGDDFTIPPDVMIETLQRMYDDHVAHLDR